MRTRRAASAWIASRSGDSVKHLRLDVGGMCFTAAMTGCRTCSLSALHDAGKLPPWDSIVRTPGWDIVHAFGTSVAGWTVLVARRHITAVADMTDAEALELGPLIKNVSRALHRTMGCRKTYVVQFAEHPNHPHVHVHVIPRANDLPEELLGPGSSGSSGFGGPARSPNRS